MSEQTEISSIKKKIVSTGIRVGTAVKTKFMRQYITESSPEGLYMLDIDMTLSRIKTAAKFVSRKDIKRVIICSGREYAGTPIEKFCECTGADNDASKIYARNFDKSIITILHRTSTTC